MKLQTFILSTFVIFHHLSSIFSEEIQNRAQFTANHDITKDKIEPEDPPGSYRINLKIPTFLGNQYRKFYGKGPVPNNLKIIWKRYLGGGKTKVWNKIKKWYGTGWPGQATLVEENGKLYILFGAMDYHLWKLDATTGEIVWKHKFGNVIKGTPVLFINPKARNAKEKGIVFCGSRRDFSKKGKPKEVKNFRAISLLTGEELWSFSIHPTDSYSRDVDAPGLLVDDILYLGAENGILYIINPIEFDTKLNRLQPRILSMLKLYTKEDIQKHNRNLVIESYPALIEDTIYVTTGSGHLYGIDKSTNQIKFDFYIGADLNSTPVVNKKGNLLIGVEKQYIKGKGGVFMIDPMKPVEECVVWYFPVEDKGFSGWEGGVIGSVAINDEYNTDNQKPNLVAFCALDGYIYVVSQDEISSDKVQGPDPQKYYPAPKLIWKKKIGPSISTPIFIDNYLIVCGYHGKIHIFEIIYEKHDGNKWNVQITEKTSLPLSGSIESTPIVWEGKIYIGCKSGYYYCLGE